MSRKTLYGAIAAGVLLVIAVAYMIFTFVGPGGEPEPTETPTAAVPAPTAEPSGEQTDDAGDASDAEAVAVAEKFIEARFSQSHDDPTPNTWYEAIKPYTTEDYYADSIAGVDPNAAGTMWADYGYFEIDEYPTVTSTEVARGGEFVLVQFILNTDSTNGDYTSQESAVLRMEQVDDNWLVSGMDEDMADYGEFFSDAGEQL